ncbi:MAG: hypothetical protein K8W52_07070, partial [Deltaproteobacteria bacterium]|nr:hypothetical protein [Deltaproteobacteria bacterium]
MAQHRAERGQRQRGEQRERRQVREGRALRQRAAQPGAADRAMPEPVLEREPAVAGEVVPDMAEVRLVGRLGRERDRQRRDVGLVLAGVPGQRLDRAPVPVAAREVHARVDLRRIGAQDRLDAAGRADERLPVEHVEHAQRADRGLDADRGRERDLLVGARHGRLVAVAGGAGRHAQL